MRMRTLKPGYFKDEELAALPPLTRIFYAGLWCVADSAGRGEDRPARLKAEILPYDDADPSVMLAELERAGFLRRYEHAGKRYFWIPGFARHQRLTGWEAQRASTLPPHPDDAVTPESEITQEKQKQDRHTTETSPKHGGTRAPFPLSQILRSGSGSEEEVQEEETPPEPPVLSFPCVGGETWSLTQQQLSRWQETYTACDVLSECKKALAWVEANQPKTRRGMPAFLNRWLAKTHDRGPGGYPPGGGRRLSRAEEQIHAVADLARETLAREAQARQRSASPRPGPLGDRYPPKGVVPVQDDRALETAS